MTYVLFLSLSEKTNHMAQKSERE